MRIDWTLNLSTVITTLIFLATLGWAALRRIDNLFTKLDALQKKVDETSDTVTATRKEVNTQGHRLTRLDTLMELMIPRVIPDASVRGVARGIAQEREAEAEG